MPRDNTKLGIQVAALPKWFYGFLIWEMLAAFIAPFVGINQINAFAGLVTMDATTHNIGVTAGLALMGSIVFFFAVVVLVAARSRLFIAFFVMQNAVLAAASGVSLAMVISHFFAGAETTFPTAFIVMFIVPFALFLLSLCIWTPVLIKSSELRVVYPAKKDSIDAPEIDVEGQETDPDIVDPLDGFEEDESIEFSEESIMPAATEPPLSYENELPAEYAQEPPSPENAPNDGYYAAEQVVAFDDEEPATNGGEELYRPQHEADRQSAQYSGSDILSEDDDLFE